MDSHLGPNIVTRITSPYISYEQIRVSQEIGFGFRVSQETGILVSQETGFDYLHPIDLMVRQATVL